MTEVLTRSAPSEISGLGLDRPVTPMINSARIARRVRQLGRQISEVYADIDTPLVMVVILKGATVFAADLLRSLSIPADLELGGNAQAAQQVGGENRGAFEDDDHHQRRVDVG